MFDASSLRKLKLPGLVAMALVILVAGYYLLLAIRRNTYLTTSNIRLLTTIGHQFDEWVQRQERIFRIVISDKDPATMTKEWKSAPTWKFGEQPRPEHASALELEPPTLVVDASGKLSLELNSRLGGKRFDQRIVPFDAPIFESLQRDNFDIVLLASPDGRILKQSGQADLHLADLGSLMPGDSGLRAGQIADVEDLAGTDYRLFMQWCCGRVRVRLADAAQEALARTESTSGVEPKPTATPEGKKPGKAGSGEGGVGKARSGLFVCGLVPAGTLTERRFSVSLSTMLIIAGVLLMTVVSWPFLKLALIGNRQRVRLLDVLLLGMSSLLVLSIGTLYLLDSYAYTRLGTHIDEGLKALSIDIRSNMTHEIAAAYSQLRALQSAARAEKTSDPEVPPDVRQKPIPDFPYYPFFDAFSLINSKGLQQRRWSVHSPFLRPISVADHPYFLSLKENQTWTLPSEDGLPEIKQFVLESTRSITRMTSQAVLAIHNNSPGEDLSVAALAFPMISLIKPVVPPGFGFAVIEDKDNGRVMFHSDDRRNLIEQFFLETDMDRRLRSVVAARRAELMDLRYWGRDYRAFAVPLTGFPWSLVTFYEKDQVRSVNVDWMFTTLLFLIPYMGACLGVCFLILILPQRRPTWLWPHPRGMTAYLQLAAFYIAVILVSGAAIYASGREELGGKRVADSFLFLLAFALPAMAWTVTYWRLRAARQAAPIAGDEDTDPTRDAGKRPWAEPNELLALSYMGAAALLLVITAALPTAAFFKLAHSIQVVPFIKNNQVKLAAELEKRRQRAKKEEVSLSEKEAASLSEKEKSVIFSRKTAILDDTQLEYENGSGGNTKIAAVDIYYKPFSTEIRKVLPDDFARSRLKFDSAHLADPLTEFLEPYLPYYSDLSVDRRELLHDKSDDRSRFWERAPQNRIVLTSAYGDGGLRISSEIPTFGRLPAFFKERPLGLVLVFGAIFCLAVAITIFAARRVFLLDVPFWSAGSGGFAAPGQSVFVVCREEELKEAYVADRRFERLDLAALASPSAKPEDWDKALSNLEKTLSGEPILLDHFEEGSGDTQWSARKLWLVEQLVRPRGRRLVILSSLGPFPLQHWNLPAEPAAKEEGPSAEQRWASLVTSSFVIMDLDPRFETDAIAGSIAPGRMTRLAQTVGTGWRDSLRNLSARVRVRQYREVRRVLERECAGNPFLSSIHDDLDRMIRRRGEEGLDREEVLAEIEERASNYYEGLWACCSPVEKLALEHLAEDGFANYRDGKIVRRLIARGLVRRDPHLRLMNETFRRFVVSTVRRKEIAELEQETEASAWDRLKRPFALILALVVVIFVATQKERFDATMAVILGATGVLPSLLKLAGLLIGDKSPLPVKSG